MNVFLFFPVIALGALAPLANTIAQSGTPASAGVTTIYRQVTPDGRIVYSDKVLKGGKLDQTITVDPPIKGNLWTAEAGPRPVTVPRTESTPIGTGAPLPMLSKRKTYDDADSDVIRAEMLLEDARKRQEAGVEPLPGERTGNVSGGSRLNEAYRARQRALAQQIVEAEIALRKAVSERDRLR
ncbi:MAG: hypothetical protein JWR25_1169 [Noviherbaspirillum sp.]|nr:hypothetical protein [Noviherbaspirillum sp.]MDB5794790.1 hypothetical protein [Noviherbaspirillum sp.]